MKERMKKGKWLIALLMLVVLIAVPLATIADTDEDLHEYGLNVGQNGIFALGDPIMVIAANKPQTENVWVGIFSEKTGIVEEEIIAWYYVDGDYYTDGDMNGEWANIRNHHLKEDSRYKDFPLGTYYVAIFKSDDFSSIIPAETRTITIKPHAISTDKSSYNCGEPIMVTTEYPGRYGTTAWVGLYRAGDEPGTYEPSIYWRNITSNSPVNIFGTAAGNNASATEKLQTSENNRYKVAMFYDGGYDMRNSSATFTINHTYHNTVTAPTCSAKGYTTHTCTACGFSYKDTYTNEDKSKHTGLTKDKAVAATCTTDGLTEGEHCADCGTVTKKQETIPGGHKVTEVKGNPATCTEDGTYTHWNCSVCKKNFETAAATKEMTTIVEGKLGHLWDDGKVTDAATCEKEGVMTFTCKRNASHTDEQVIPMNKHVLSYTEANNVITETCGTCSHSVTATLNQLEESYPYTGEAIEPLTVTNYGEGWLGEALTISYENNVDAGDAKAFVSHKNELLTTKPFKITPAALSVTAENIEVIYDGNSHSITVEGAPEDAVITYTDDLNKAYAETNPAYTDVCTKTVYYKVEKKNYYVAGSATVTIKQADNQWQSGPSIENWTYGEDSKEPDAKSLFGDVTVEYRPATGSDDDYTTTVPTEAGTYVVRFTVAETDNYTGLAEEKTLTISKAAQTKTPAAGADDETIKGKADGTITDVDDTMEYRKEGETAYTAITSETVTDLEPGTYYVRYKETANHEASAEKEVIIKEGRELTVTVPTEQIGYTLTADKSILTWHETVKVVFTLQEGYSKTDDFAVKVNDRPETLGFDGTYIVPAAEDDIVITVEGVADITPPVAEIALAEHKWNAFSGSVEDLFFKEKQDAAIAAADTGSGIKEVLYYLAGEELSLEDAIALDPSLWKDYDAAIRIQPQEEYIVYAKATDKAGNVTIVHSDRIVIDSIVPEIIFGKYENFYGDTTFEPRDKYLDKVYVDGVEVELEDGKYTIIADGKEHTITVTDKAGNCTEVKKTLIPIASIDDDIEDIKTDDVKSSDKEAIEDVKELTEAIIDSGKDYTDAEDKTLGEIQDHVKDLLDKIAEVQAEMAEITAKVGAYEEGVTCKDKEAIETLIARTDVLLDGNNLTDDERDSMTAVKGQAAEFLEVIKTKNPVYHFPGKAATCLEPQTCTHCKIELTPAKDHDWDEGAVAKKPTCTEKGEMLFVCKRDASHTDRKPISIVQDAHDWNEGVVTKKPTCSAEGETTYTCKLNKDHTYTKPIAIDKDAHDWDTEGTVTKEPTCVEEGETTYICKLNKDHTYTVTIPALGHELEFVEGKEPTYTEEGIIDHYICTECDRYFEDEEALVEIFDITIPKLEKVEEEDNEEEAEPAKKEEPAKKPEPVKKANKDIPDTGDSNQVFAWLTLLTAGCAAAFVARTTRRKIK